MTRGKGRLGLALLAVGLTGVLAGCAGSSAGSAGTPVAGAPSGGVSGGGAEGTSVTLPDLELPGLPPASAVRLSQLRGPAVVNVWASWCPPCRAELPVLATVAEQAAGRVQFLGIDVLDRDVAAAETVAAFGVPYPSVVDAEGATRGPLRWVGPPMTYLVDADGRVVHVEAGQLSDADELRGLIETHLGVAL